MSKLHPNDLTSYDFLKTLAIVLMIVDHIGYYFDPGNDWWRVAGRLCVPIWFFLIGYARTRDLEPRLWIGCLILLAANVVAGMSLMPLNILATMICLRMLIDRTALFALSDRVNYWAMGVGLVILSIPTSMVVEYGTLALIMALCGYIARHRDAVPQGRALMLRFFAFGLVSYVALQSLIFVFDRTEMIVLALGTAAVMGLLTLFRSQTYPALTAALPRFVVCAVQFTGRRTLEIYVGHLLLFKAIALFTQPERFVLFDWKLLSPTGL